VRRRALAALVAFSCLLVLGISTATAQHPLENKFANRFTVGEAPPVSGAYQFGDMELGIGITECPQAGLRGDALHPQPLDRRQEDRVEQVSDTGNDIRTNQDYSCMPHDETTVGVNPTNTRNIVTAQNDYRLGWGTSGINSSTDRGNSWYSLIAPFPSLPDGDNLDGGGDPVIVFDREGVTYYAEINFNRTDDESGIWVMRSTNGGFTWTRPCVAIDATPGDPTDDQARCGGVGDPRQPGDGTVVYNDDPDQMLNFSVPFHDKEYMAAGPRPAGVEPVCFTPIQRAPRACDPAQVGVDRIYVTWTAFEPGGLFGFTSEILLSYSDDQARSWSPPRAISGSAPFCGFSLPPGSCDLNQFSVPTVHQETGLLGVAFENFNTEDENQYLFVRSRDGGNTFEGPFFVTPVFDVNFPRAGASGGRPDCTARGQQSGRIVYTNSCFRSNAGGNVQVDMRGGAFADDFYLVMSDNRNGTRASSNADVFLFVSKDGGTTWIGPTRVNDDRSDLGGVSRECDLDDPECLGDFGNDQWWPWADISPKGHLNVTFNDRRLDEDSVAHEWPTSRQRPGNYLVWRWGANCQITVSASRQCLAPGAEVVPQPSDQCLELVIEDGEIIDVVPGLAECSNPGEDPVPGQGEEFLGPFDNFGVSDVPSNYDYSFRAGIFAGDYDNTEVVGEHAWGTWTDARNGRSSRNQAGRNPACEQSDVFVDDWAAAGQAAGQNKPRATDELFLVTLCPTDIADPGAGRR
jgi:hypothetical protein